MTNTASGKEPKKWIYRHSYNVRICHWIVVISFAYLVVSGVNIFLDFPELYWGKVGFQGYPAAFKLSDWGISWEEAGAMGNRRWGRNYHFLFAWVFVINGFIYLSWNLWRKQFYRKMLPQRDELSLSHLKVEIINHLRFRKPQGDRARGYNVLQKISYLLVLFLLFPFMILSGLAQMPANTAIFPELIDLFGGRQTARTLHVVATVVLLLFVIIHVIEVFVVGVVNAMRSMITGKYVLPEEEQEQETT